MAEAGVRLQGWKKVASYFLLSLVVFLLPANSSAYYVGPEVGKSPVETRLIPGARNVSSLAEAAYVPYVYSVGNNIVTFLRSIVPGLQPKVDFFAEQIQDGIDVANTKLMQTLENSNNGIIAVENFFTGLMKAFVFGKGPDDEERRRRLAMALIRSGMLEVSTVRTTRGTSTSTTTTTTTSTTTTTTGRPVLKSPEKNVSERLVRGATTTNTPTPSLPSGGEKMEPAVKEKENPNKEELDDANFMEQGTKVRDNQFNKMRVVSIVNNML